MLRRHRPRLAAAIVVGAVCCPTAGALAAVGGTYSGSAGPAYSIKVQASGTKVTGITITCDRGAITVEAAGPFPRIVNDKFSYSGKERSSLSTRTTLTMHVTGTFTRSGRKLSGSASTDRQCKSGSYKASK